MVITKGKEPAIRAEAYNLYWTFAAKRHAIFEQRVAGKPGPWTDDEILREYKFCNVFRAVDRISQYLIADVAYNATPDSIEDRLFQIVAFRLFSKAETWEHVQNHLGHAPKVRNLGDGSFLKAIASAREAGGPIYTAAFILCASNAFDRPTKHENHVELLRYMFVRERLGSRILEAKSLGDLFGLLKGFPLIGNFMAYQLAIDLNYSAHVTHSEDEFTCPGPGALRGMKKAFVHLGDYSHEDVIRWMVDRQEDEFRRLGLSFNGLRGRRLHLIDCQGLFCELDKYCREALPQLKSNRSRIKARFTPVSTTFKLFLPPKWALSEDQHSTEGEGPKQIDESMIKVRQRETKL